MSEADVLQRDRSGYTLARAAPTRPHEHALHPAWQAFVRFCGEMQHGKIERLRIQDSLPVLAEVVKKKVKFTE